MRLKKGLRRLRAAKQYREIRRALHAVNQRPGFHVCEFSIQANHYHLLIEASHRLALSRGMQALNIRVARALNRIAKRKGGVFDDRYDARVLSTPRQARNALAYVINNGRRHNEHWEKPRDWIDPYSSAEYFDGWTQNRSPATGPPGPIQPPPDELVVLPARSWLLTDGWKRYGRIDPRERPGPAVEWGG